jgi:hypothetical protein
MPDRPVIRIHCRRASDIKLGSRVRSGLLISSSDLNTLRLLADRDVAVSLECNGVIIFQAQVKQLLQRVTYLADRELWFVPSSLTGPLRPPLPPAKDE